MSEPTPESTPESTPEQPPEGEPTVGKTFDEGYVKKLRDEAARYRTESKANAEAAKKLAEYEERDKTDQQRAVERAEKAERDLADARLTTARTQVALDKGLTAGQAKRLLGTTVEELTADADALLTELGTPASAVGTPAPRRPVEQLRPGASSSDPLPADPRARARAQMEADIKVGSRTY